MATIAEERRTSALSVVLPVMLLAGLIGGLALTTGLIDTGGIGGALPGPPTVTVPPRTFTYRSDGDFVRAGIPVDAPLETVAVASPLHVMKFQVTVADYALCVADRACAAAESRPASIQTVPVTGVSYDDARAYADWLSTRTRQVWRLPSDAEWAFAAGTRFADDALGIALNNKNPAIRWIANYERESARKAGSLQAAQPQGNFGENEYGIADIGGNVWEWTGTCHRRVVMDGDGRIISQAPACGVYVLEGKHRAPMSFFIRDAKGGGCSVGTPPDNLGFRLVRDSRWYAPLIRAFETSRLRPA
ncbi:nitrate reductase [Aureimonas sp. SA4125]|uniref:SUMF1/EgtB/PvdO family nonheme iron enzyme n=1 Tax=Aureimonas sp. SA4125 TaxID=2826993 RepID=UPI001CC46270|nr:formylglycine-generating enzyme family protein [Aureimonas sp. SA4125]BDA85410.1 nitrate reductase [Aureimonas sp. SA4125]